MSVPELNADGLLPVGVFDGTLEEVRQRFGGLLRRRFGFDVVLAEAGTGLYRAYVEFFGRVREAPHWRKGMVRVLL